MHGALRVADKAAGAQSLVKRVSEEALLPRPLVVMHSSQNGTKLRRGGGGGGGAVC
jgi:hypothetical protein